MNHSILALTLPYLVLAGLLAAAAPQETGLHRITIETGTSWYLTIRPDGSASYGYGNGIGIQTRPGLFDFEKVEQRLRAGAARSPGGKPRFAVWFRSRDEESRKAMYVHDIELIRSLFERARSDSSAPEIDELWARKPPVPPQPSTRATSQPASRPSTTRATTSPARE